VKTIETKQEFAARKNRKPSAISNWIAAGKISRTALVGEGVRARIWVEQAERDLMVSLDPGQQSAQPVPVTASLPSDTIFRPAPAAEDEDLKRRRKADADRAEHEAESAKRKLLVDSGRYVVAADAAAAWGRESAKMVSDVETFMSTTLAREIAENHGLDWRAVSVEMRESFRKHRATAAENAALRREAIEQETTGAD
jgi:hypothetical protein